MQTWTGSQTPAGPERVGWGIEGKVGSSGRPPLPVMFHLEMSVGVGGGRVRLAMRESGATEPGPQDER